MAWKYERKESQITVPVGKHRLRIENAEMGQAKSSGNDMISLTLSISGSNLHIWDRIVFLEDKPDVTNRMCTAVFDAFGIEEGNFDFATWRGRVGVAQTKIDESGYAKIAYYVKKGKEGDLPPWVEPTSHTPATGGGTSPVYETGDDDMPF